MKLDSTNFYDSISDGKVLVKFEASWCGPCKAYAPTFKQFSEENDTVKCFSLDCQVAPEIAEDFDVKSIPVTILFKDGEEISRKPGKLTKEQLLGIVRHGLTFIGGLLLMKGLVDEAILSEISGAVITLTGAIWSIINKKQA